MTYTLDDKVEAISRELKLRQRVYPRWVENGRMTQVKAEYEINVMRAILADYQLQAQNALLL